MTKKDVLDVVKTTAILLAICVFITAALAITNAYTKDPIEKINKENEKATMQEIIDAEVFESINVEYEGEYYSVNKALKSNEVIGYVFSLNEKGYGGDVSVMVGIGIDSKIISVRITDASNETPGLGQNVTKESFYNQYSEKSGELEVVKSGANENQITAVTGATISSKAVTKAVNKSLKIFEHLNIQNGGTN